ncbi:MAG: hypothetical protein H6Q67_2226 [Firmicutes bacterium]|nr:hypothetical protein [Bacillota bacterium]
MHLISYSKNEALFFVETTLGRISNKRNPNFRDYVYFIQGNAEAQIGTRRTSQRAAERFGSSSVMNCNSIFSNGRLE